MAGGLISAVRLQVLAVLAAFSSAGVTQEVDTRQPAPVEKLEDGRVKIGGVMVDSVRRTATFPARGCMQEGMIEYFLVHENGKTHEAVLKTSVAPYHLHTAMLLLGARQEAAADGGRPPERIDAGYLETAPAPSGPAVGITVSWRQDSEDLSIDAGDLVRNTETDKKIAAGAWAYNGSMFFEGEFLAQTSGSIISIITDPEALVNHTGPGRMNDLAWEVNVGRAPAVDNEVTVTIKLESGPEGAAQ